MRRLSSSSPSPAPSTPQLFDTVTSSDVPCSSSASINRIGTPHNPNPPTASDAPSGMSRTAAVTEVTVLSIRAPLPGVEVVARLGPYPEPGSKVPARGPHHDGK